MKTTNPELSFLVSQITEYLDNGNQVPKDMVDRYTRLLKEQPGETLMAYAGALRADSLVGSQNYFEALVSYERAIKDYPTDLYLQLNWSSLVRRIQEAVENLGKKEPQSAEFGRCYAMLVKLGTISLTSHVAAVHHYRFCGEHDRAVALAVKIHQVAPNFEGLKAAIELLRKESDDARLAAMV